MSMSDLHKYWRAPALRASSTPRPSQLATAVVFPPSVFTVIGRIGRTHPTPSASHGPHHLLHHSLHLLLQLHLHPPPPPHLPHLHGVDGRALLCWMLVVKCCVESQSALAAREGRLLAHRPAGVRARILYTEHCGAVLEPTAGTPCTLYTVAGV